jgi:hypothetical protein
MMQFVISIGHMMRYNSIVSYDADGVKTINPARIPAIEIR